MKLIIAGSRSIELSQDEILNQLSSNKIPKVTEIVCGLAKGVDMSGRLFADTYNIPVKGFLADWNTHGKAAGPIRNKQMADYADALLLIWTGEQKTSPGSYNMKQQMLKLNKPIYEVILKGL